MKDTIKSLSKLPQGADVAPEGAGENVSPQFTASVPCLYLDGDIVLNEEGYIYIHRKICNPDHWVWQLHLPQFRFYIYLILQVRWSDTEADFTAPNGEIIKIRKGQYACAIRRLAEEAGLTPQNIRTGLKILEKRQFLTHEITHGISVLTLLNYRDYQAGGMYANTPTNTSPTQAQHKPNTLKNKDNKVNKVNKINNKEYYSDEIENTIKILAKIPGVTPDMLQLTPERLVEYIEKWPDIDPIKIADSMLAWYSGNDKKIKNVSSAMRGWFQRDYDEYENCWRDSWTQNPMGIVE